MKLVNTLLIILILLLTGFYFSNYSISKSEILITSDTVFIIKNDTLLFEKQGEVKFKRDTLIVTKPFESSIDTNWKDKLLNINYSYPENNLKVSLTEKDTIQFRTKTIKTQSSFDWIDFLVGIILGLIIGIL